MPEHNDIVDVTICGARVIDVVRDHSAGGGRLVVFSHAGMKYWLETPPGGVGLTVTGAVTAPVSGVAG